jgi:hypothetical protein
MYIRPVLEYASIVFRQSLPKYLSENIERIQKRAHSVTYPGLKYEDAALESGLPTRGGKIFCSLGPQEVHWKISC